MKIRWDLPGKWGRPNVCACGSAPPSSGWACHSQCSGSHLAASVLDSPSSRWTQDNNRTQSEHRTNTYIYMYVCTYVYTQDSILKSFLSSPSHWKQLLWWVLYTSKYALLEYLWPKLRLLTCMCRCARVICYWVYLATKSTYTYMYITAIGAALCTQVMLLEY